MNIETVCDTISSQAPLGRDSRIVFSLWRCMKRPSQCVANHPYQQQASSSSLGGPMIRELDGPIVLHEASANSGAATSSSSLGGPMMNTQLDGPIVLHEASAISGAATLGSILNSTPEGQLMFRTVTSLHAPTVGKLCANAPIISVTAAATHDDKQKYDEIAKKYALYGVGAPEKELDQDTVWIAGDKKLHPFKWISRKDEHGKEKPPTPGVSSCPQKEIKDRHLEMLFRAPMYLQFHDNFVDAMSISNSNAKAKKALQLVAYEFPTTGEWWQVMFQAKNLVGWQSVLESLGYKGAQDLESKEDVLLAISQVLEADFSIAQ